MYLWKSGSFFLKHPVCCCIVTLITGIANSFMMWLNMFLVCCFIVAPITGDNKLLHDVTLHVPTCCFRLPFCVVAVAAVYTKEYSTVYTTQHCTPNSSVQHTAVYNTQYWTPHSSVQHAALHTTQHCTPHNSVCHTVVYTPQQYIHHSSIHHTAVYTIQQCTPHGSVNTHQCKPRNRVHHTAV